MKRRVVKQGAATFTVSLPAEWIRQFGVKAGDFLDVEARGKELNITPERVRIGRKSEIDVNGLDPSLIRHHVLSHYIQGDEEIVISVSDPKMSRVVQDLTNTLIGIAVVEQKKNALVIREVSVPKSEEFDSFMRRIFFSLKQLAGESLEKITARDWDGLLETEKIEKLEVNKFAYLCMRLLNREGHRDFRKTPLIFDMVRMLENIGDEYWRICGDAYVTKPRLSRETVESYKQMNQLIDDIYTVFYSFDKEQLNDIYARVRNIRKTKMEKLLSQKSKEEAIVLLRLKKIAELMGYLLESIMVIYL